VVPVGQMSLTTGEPLADRAKKLYCFMRLALAQSTSEMTQQNHSNS